MNTEQAPSSHPLLEVRDVVTRFHTRRGVVHAVNGLSYSLAEGEALALVGESGSGKSVSALSLMGLVPPPGRVAAGQALLAGRDLLALSDKALRDVRGREVAMVFQDPMTSLNPVLTVGYQLTEAMRRHLGMDEAAAVAEAIRLLTLVGIPEPARRVDSYPHELSGGQRQRVMIAMALACRPKVLIADEPTTALDVTVQAQIVALVKRLQREMGMAVLWITHDLALVAGLVDRVAVMYGGRIVEEAPVGELFRSPRHPYTRGLLRSMPTLTGAAGTRLAVIDGRPPDLLTSPVGCAFAPRCERAVDRCRTESPPVDVPEPRHRVACWRHAEPDDGWAGPIEEPMS